MTERQIALVTGASSGFGRVIARQLHHREYRVFGTSRSTDVVAEPGVEMLTLFGQASRVGANVKAIVVGCLTGVAVTVAVYVGMLLSTWTVIHSGWSSEAIAAFYRSVYVAPPLSGVASGWLAYRLARLKGVE